MRRTGPDRRTRELVKRRANYRCEVCAGPGQHIHHRQPRKMGGTTRQHINRASNLLLLCVQCHAHVEAHRADAYRLGLLVKEPQLPAEVSALLLLHGRVLLDDAGGITPMCTNQDGGRVTAAIEVTPQWIADIANRLDALHKDIESIRPDPIGPRTLRVHWAPEVIRRAGDLAGLALGELPPGRDASDTSVSEAVRPLGLTFMHVACLADLVDTWLAMASDEPAALESDTPAPTLTRADVTAQADAALAALATGDPDSAHGLADDAYASVLRAVAAGHPHAQRLAQEALRLDRVDVRRWTA